MTSIRVPDWLWLILVAAIAFLFGTVLPETTEKIADWLGHYPITTIITIAICLISWNLFNGGLGLCDLFWHRNIIWQFFIGLSAGLLVCQLLFTVQVVDMVNSSFEDPIPPSPTEATLALLPYAGLITGLISFPAFNHLHRRWALPLGAVCALFFFLGAAKLTDTTGNQQNIKKKDDLRLNKVLPPKMIEKMSDNQDASPKINNNNKQSDETKWREASDRLITCWSFFTLIIFLLCVAYVAFEWVPFLPSLPPVLSLFALLGLLNSFACLLRLSSQPIVVWALFIIAVMVCGYVANRNPFKMWIPGLEKHYSNPVDIGPTSSALTTQLDPPLVQSSTVLQNAFNNWLAANKPAGLPPKPPLVILCVSGGGSRAAVWACAILEELRRQELALRANRNPHPPGGGLLVDQIRIITGASGGIVGSAYYTAFSALGGGIPPKGVQAEIAAWSARNKGAACPELAWALARDHLSAVVSTMLLYDLPWTWVPFRTCIIDPTRMPSNWSAWDRGRSLEKALADNTRPKGKKATSPLESPHAALAPFEQSALIPSIIYSPMLVEDARRLLISNLDLSALCEIDVPYGSGVRRLSRPAIEFYKIFPEARATFQVCTAARLAASFPFVSPALFLPTEPKRRVVDAGYYDNYGVDLAAEWVYHNSQDISTHCSSVLFLETRAYANEADRQSLFSSDDGGFIRGLSSPLSAVMTMRERSPWYRNDERLRGMGDLFAERHKAPRFVVSEYVELDGTAPLGWSMTERQRDEIIQSASTAVSQLLVRLRNVYKWI